MPEGPALYEDGVVTDESLEDRIAEIIREAALDGVRDELPHSIAVTIDDIAARDTGSLTDIYANIVVERDSQKAIISRLAPSAARARADRAARRHEGVLEAARARRQGMAARSEAARTAGVLIPPRST
jgi:hypothetical protein